MKRTTAALLVGELLLIACSNGERSGPPVIIAPEPKTTPPATATAEVTKTFTPLPTRIAIATPTLRPIEAVPSPYAVATRALDDDRDLIDRQNNVIATLNGNRNLLSFMENGPLTETQLKALMEKNNIGLAFKNGVNNNPDKLFRMEKGELKEIPIPQLTPQLTPDDFWSDQDNPEYPHALVTEKPGTKTHVVFDGKNWVENIDGKSTGRVVFDMQKEKAAIGGAIPGDKETVVTVTPKPPQKDTPKIPVLGITKEGIDLDDALAKMQTNPPTVPEWITVGDKGVPASLLRLSVPGTIVAQKPGLLPYWQFNLENLDGQKLLSSMGIESETVRFSMVKVTGTSGVTIPTDVSVRLDNLSWLKNKNIVVLGVLPNDAKNRKSRFLMEGLGVVVK